MYQGNFPIESVLTRKRCESTAEAKVLFYDPPCQDVLYILYFIVLHLPKSSGIRQKKYGAGLATM